MMPTNQISNYFTLNFILNFMHRFLRPI